MSTLRPTIEAQPIDIIGTRIVVLRGQKVMIDADLAELYGVPTKRLNEQVKRNHERFPQDFVFQLTTEEKREVVANCDHLAKLKFSNALPFAFTEHGAIQAANVLATKQSVEMGFMWCAPSCGYANCWRRTRNSPGASMTWNARSSRSWPRMTKPLLG